MNKYIYIFVLIGILFTCCKTGDKRQAEIKPNDQFRVEILSGLKLHEDTAKIFSTVLDKLDSKDITYGAFYKKMFYEIEDSCYYAHKNFLDSLSMINSRLHSAYIDSIRNKASGEYQNQLSISDNELDAVLYVTTLSPSIKIHLNQLYNLNLYIPEEE